MTRRIGPPGLVRPCPHGLAACQFASRTRETFIPVEVNA